MKEVKNILCYKQGERDKDWNLKLLLEKEYILYTSVHKHIFPQDNIN